MRRLTLVTFACAAFGASTSAAAQFGGDPAALVAKQREALSRLARIDGVWRGPAWTILQNGTRHEITQTERIGPFLNGSVKVIEGRGYNADGTPGFNALGIISYDLNTLAYKLHSYAQGSAGDFEMKLTDTGYVWEIPAGPTMTIRYTATITDNSWLEVGDRVMTGRAPVRFFEMNLKRVGSTTWPLAGQISPADSTKVLHE